MNTRRILISAAEPSGDVLGAALIEALISESTQNIHAFGLTGPKMRSVGVETLFKMEDMCAMGLIEVLKKRKPILEAKSRLHSALEGKVDLCVAIDAPDLHLPLLKAAKSKSIFSVGYVSPQIWAWRKGRSKKIAESMDRLLCLFDFEPALYPKEFDAQWVGHPIVDRRKPLQRQSVRPMHFALFPGSRQHEIDRHLPIYIEVTKHLPHASFVLSVPGHLSTPKLPSNINRSGLGVQAALDARAALCKSGTISLELAYFNIPTVVAHRVHPLTYLMAKLFVRDLPYFAMPNILSEKEVVQEHIQHLDPKKLAHALLHAEAPNANLQSLGRPGAIKRAARALGRSA